MNYYEQLYDINFFSTSSYFAKINKSSIEIEAPGTPLWSTWQGSKLSADTASKIWHESRHTFNPASWISITENTVSDSDLLLIALILCEDAYRTFNSEQFFFYNRLLYASCDEGVRLKAIKLHKAWDAVWRLSGNVCGIKEKFCSNLDAYQYSQYNTEILPLQLVIDSAISYLMSVGYKPCTCDDFKVEKPVAEDWQKQGVSSNSVTDVVDFYKTTHSYILELTAANYQVETLFNYTVIIDLLKKLGVNSVFDYGAGIGTFVELASTYGMSCAYADLNSLTMDFAKTRFNDSGYKIKTFELDPFGANLFKKFDCVVCTEVLEHIFKPDQLVREIYSHLRPGGLFVVSESFDYSEDFCSHLHFHRGKGGGVFLSFLKSIGFRQMLTEFSLHPTIHIRF